MSRKRHRWLAWTLAPAALAWAVFCPSYLTRRAIERSLMRALNDPKTGLECRSVVSDFTYAGLFLGGHVGRLDVSGIRLDASPYLTGDFAEAFSNRQVTADFSLAPDPAAGKGRMRGVVRADVLGIPLKVTADADCAPFGWKVAVETGFSAKIKLKDKEYAVDGLRIRGGATGFLWHTDLSPTSVRARTIGAAGFELANAYATVRAVERGFLVTEAGAGFCGGQARLYSLTLNPETLNAGFTLFLDDIDAGRVLGCVPGFRGEATGRLHGKLPLYVREGRELRLKDAFLYSVPGETGKLRIDDASTITANLAAGGVSEATCENLSKALADLDYTVLKLDLRREAKGEMALGVKIEGTATSGKTTVPVSFAVTLHGDLEQLVNFGLRTATK